jgi:hypothetical protein
VPALLRRVRRAATNGVRAVPALPPVSAQLGHRQRRRRSPSAAYAVAGPVNMGHRASSDRPVPPHSQEVNRPCGRHERHRAAAGVVRTRAGAAYDGVTDVTTQRRPEGQTASGQLGQQHSGHYHSDLANRLGADVLTLGASHGHATCAEWLVVPELLSLSLASARRNPVALRACCRAQGSRTSVPIARRTCLRAAFRSAARPTTSR